MATPPDEPRLSEQALRKLENAVLYALTASSSKLHIPSGTRIYALYARLLDDLYIVGDRRRWLWDHIEYGASLVRGARKPPRDSDQAKGAKSVLDVWTVVLKAQPGSPSPQDPPVT